MELVNHSNNEGNPTWKTTRGYEQAYYERRGKAEVAAKEVVRGVRRVVMGVRGAWIKVGGDDDGVGGRQKSQRYFEDIGLKKEAMGLVRKMKCKGCGKDGHIVKYCY